MTEKEFKRKYDEIIEWCINETDKVTRKLEKENKIHGLDTNTYEYKEIHEKYRAKINNLIKEFKQ